MSTGETIDFSAVPLANLELHEAISEIIRQAVGLAASDLFLLSDESATDVSVRAMGQIERVALVPRELGRHLINYFKTQSGADIAERRRPQEGRWIYENNGDRVDLRINIVPTLYGEDVAVRILDRRFGLRSLDGLGLSRNDYNRLTGLLASPSGLLLVTGPTGTAKTTTLYACLHHLNPGTRQINTIEQPTQ